MFEPVTSDEFIQKLLFRISRKPITIPAEKIDLAKELLRYMMGTEKYGYFSLHRTAKAVDISSSYKYLNELKKHLILYKKEGRTIFSLSDTESYNHLHVSYLL